MWSAPGQRVTSAPTFQPDATPEVRGAVPATCARQLAAPQPRRRAFRRCHRPGARGDGTLGLVLRRVRLRQRRLGRPLHRQRHADAIGRCRGRARSRKLLLAPGGRAFAAHADSGNAVRRGVAGDQPAAGARIDREPTEERVPAQRRSRRLRRGLRARSGSTSIRTAGRSRCSTSIAMATRTSCVMAARQAPQLRVFRNDFATLTLAAGSLASGGAGGPARRRQEQPRCDWGARHGRNRSHAPDEDRPGRIGIPVAALERAAASGSARANASSR